MDTDAKRRACGVLQKELGEAYDTMTKAHRDAAELFGLETLEARVARDLAQNLAAVNYEVAKRAAQARYDKAIKEGAMKKIPTIFERAWDGDKTLIPTPTAAHAMLGGATATVKYDGMAVAVIGGKLYKRYDAKRGKQPPEGAIPCDDPDPITGHWPHWIAVTDAPENKYLLATGYDDESGDGTFEFIGPKVNGNPYKIGAHCFVRHGADSIIPLPPTDYDGLKQWLSDHSELEGIVWWKDGQPVGKAKRRDFGLPWPALKEGGK